jgi:hypothetical protein
MKMAHEEGLEALRGKEFEIKHTAEGKGHEEAVNPLGGDPAGISPIALCLFRGENPNRKKCFRGRLNRSQIIPEDTDTARITHSFDLFMDAHPAEIRIGFKEGLDLIFERIKLGSSIRRDRGGEGLLL